MGSTTRQFNLKGHTDEKLNLMDEYKPLVDTHYVFRIFEYIMLTYKNISIVHNGLKGYEWSCQHAKRDILNG